MLKQRRITVRQLRGHVASILDGDPDLASEARERIRGAFASEGRDAPGAEPTAPRAIAGGTELAEVIGAPEGEDLAFESIVLREGRPVLRVFHDAADLSGHIEDPASQVIARRVGDARAVLAPVIPLVGRIEVTNNPRYDWVGTGWLIDHGVIVTNRHVAQEFAQRDRARFVFQPGADPSLPQSARIDFLEEIGNAAMREVAIDRVIYIAGDGDPDMALLQLAGRSQLGNRSIPLDVATPSARDYVCVLGYPAYDSRVPDAELMNRLYGNVYDKKRLAPGQISGTREGLVLHNCTTLGGNSGSAVLNLKTGRAVALHFGGTFLKENRAVPARTLADLLRRQPWMNGGEVLTTPVATPTTPAQPQVASYNCATPAVEITIRVGGGRAPEVTATTGTSAPSTTPTSIEDAVATVRRQLAADPAIVAVKAGYEFRDEWITDRPAVVVLTDPRMQPHATIPERVGNYAVETRVADPARVLLAGTAVDTEAPHRYVSKYKKRTAAKFALDPVTARMSVLCHVSPEAGWATLKPFLGGTTDELVIGMYDFTAPHIVKAVTDAAKPAGRRLSLVLQKGESIGSGAKIDDITDEETVDELAAALKQRFDTAWAPVTGPDRLFDSSYHIKVAVRDRKAFWLSSGNWQSSNQPIVAHPQFGESSSLDLIRDHNREWHVTADDPTLSKLFREHLLQDLKDAEEFLELPDAGVQPDLIVPESWLQMDELELPRRVHYFEPKVVTDDMTVEPLLTPDNYAAKVLPFVREAQQRLWIQNQSFKPGTGDGEDAFSKILDAVLAQQRRGVDVRVIFRSIGDVQDTLERIKDFGFDMSQVRVQANCHTKGIIVDDHSVLIGSHNWTTGGTIFNRDASLIVRHPDVTAYFASIFEHDWNRLARQRVPRRRRGGDEARIVPADAEAVVPPGYVRVTWAEWTGE